VRLAFKRAELSPGNRSTAFQLEALEVSVLLSANWTYRAR